MKFAIVVVVFCVVLHQHIPSTTSISQCSTDQYVGGPLYAPIDLDTSLATQSVTVLPLTFTIGDNDRFLLTNTGQGVEITLNQPTTVNSFCGGVLGNATYQFYKIRYYWDHDFTGDASYSVDHTEYPLSIEHINFNRAYGSYENAITKPDGLVINRASINVEGCVRNEKFSALEGFLAKVVKAGSSCVINGNIRNVVYSWYDQTTVNYPFYYSYRGTYYDHSLNNTQLSNAIFLIAPKSRTGYMSVCQFSVFTSLKNEAGSPIAVVQPAYPAKYRNLTQSTGIVLNIDRKPIIKPFFPHIY